MNTRTLLVKPPWRRIKPAPALYRETSDEGDYPYNNSLYENLTEMDMLREYYPSGHKINSTAWYPDIYMENWEDVVDEDGNPTGKKVRRVYREYVPRYAFAFEQIISLKQIIHLTGNDIQYELNVTDPSEEQKLIYGQIRQGWSMKDMELRFYEAVKACKIVANVAFVGYMDDGIFGSKVLSFQKGDMLYPHRDPLTGRLKVFARRFNDYDTDGSEMVQWLEVWDEKYYYLYKRNPKERQTVSDVIMNLFRVDGWQRKDKKPHGFPFLPVAYRRDEDGPCWSPSRDSIDSYDLSFSQMAHNNEAFGEPILVLQNAAGDNETTQTDIQRGLNGTIKTISMDAESKASYLESQSAAESYMKQLDTLYKMIYEQSFAVIPPEVRSGDLPGVAVKLLYSPALEKAMSDAAEYQNFLDDMNRIYLYGYGMEMQRTVDFMNLPLKLWIKPYIHINESAVVTDLATAVQNGFLSKQTAAERNSAYSIVDEYERIKSEQKEQEKADLLYQIKTKQAASAGGGNGTGGK